MSLEKHIKIDQIKINSISDSKREILKEVVSEIKKNKELQNLNEDLLFDKLYQREDLSSTGIGNGIAIPHISISDIDNFVVGVIVNPNGIEFNAIDGNKVQIFIYIIAPKNKRNEHIRLLSEISKVLKSEKIREQIINAKNEEQVFSLFSGNNDQEVINIKQQNKYDLFHVAIQREDVFDDLLALFTEVNSISISVIDAHDARFYLQALPLFSNFWNERDETFNRIIVAVINKCFSNELLRKINVMIDDLENKRGIIVASQELNYFNGQLDL